MKFNFFLSTVLSEPQDTSMVEAFGNNYAGFIEKLLHTLNISESLHGGLKISIIIVSLIILCYIADFIAKKIILTIVARIIKKTKNSWDDVLLEKKVFDNLAHIAPAIVIEVLAPVFFKGYDNWLAFATKVADVYIVVAFALSVISFFRAFQLYLESRPFFKDKPTESYMQLVRLIIYGLAIIYIISILFDKSPWGIFSALGAMSVVLMLVFKDTILGFVASIQLSANNMVKIGDWVEFPKFGADGTVIEIKLQTIKIQNWDKTITTIPTYAFVSDAFKNWRGMEESGGRRIKRSIKIDVSTIKLCDDELLKRLNEVELLKPYLDKKISELQVHNESRKVNLTNLVNGRRLTNVGCFRAYIEAYLNNNENIHKGLTFLIRQLEPTEKGLPIEIYVFSKEQRWVQYEGIQADIFDHLFAVLNEFDLKAFQNPTGNDFKSFLK